MFKNTLHFEEILKFLLDQHSSKSLFRVIGENPRNKYQVMGKIVSLIPGYGQIPLTLGKPLMHSGPARSLFLGRWQIYLLQPPSPYCSACSKRFTQINVLKFLNYP